MLAFNTDFAREYTVAAEAQWPKLMPGVEMSTFSGYLLHVIGPDFRQHAVPSVNNLGPVPVDIGPMRLQIGGGGIAPDSVDGQFVIL